MFSEIFTFIWQKLLAELFADALQPFLAAPDRDAELLGNLQMRCSFQRDAAEQTIVLRRQQGADGVEQLADRAERPVLHGEFFALLRKILLERDEVQGLQRRRRLPTRILFLSVSISQASGFAWRMSASCLRTASKKVSCTASSA